MLERFIPPPRKLAKRIIASTIAVGYLLADAAPGCGNGSSGESYGKPVPDKASGTFVQGIYDEKNHLKGTKHFRCSSGEEITILDLNLKGGKVGYIEEPAAITCEDERIVGREVDNVARKPFMVSE